MKHLHYLAALAIGSLMLASCANDEVVSAPTTPQKAIDFKAMANKSTRADVTTNNLERIRVYGCNMDAGTTNNHVLSFNFEYVEKRDGKWTYDNIQYWAPNKDYYFVALSTNTPDRAWSFTAPTTHDATLSVDDFKGFGTVTMNLTQEIVGDNAADADQDLVYAYAARETDDEITNSSAVNLTFHHMLSRIALTFSNTFANSAYTFKVSNIKLGGLVNEATCELGAEPANLVWTPTAGSEANPTNTAQVSVLLTEGLIASTTKPIVQNRDYTYIIPGNQTLTISFNVTVLLGDKIYSERTLTGTLEANAYQPGKSYMLTAAINQDNIVEGGAKPIEFDVTSVDGWGTNETGNFELGEKTTE